MKRYRSYRMTLRRDGVLGEYYGLQGTQWKDPPILTLSRGQMLEIASTARVLTR